MKALVKKQKVLSLPKKIILFAASVLLIFAVPIHYYGNKVFACGSVSECAAEIAASQSEIDQYNAQIAELSAKAGTLQAVISGISSQISIIQAQIDISQSEYDGLVLKIAQTNEDIKNNQDALGSTLADMYVEGQTTPIEMVFSSKNVSDYMDKQEYRNSIRDQLSSTINNIKVLQAQLESQKTEAEDVLAKQTAERTSLDAARAQQQDLLNQTNGDEAIYQGLVAANKKRLSDALLQQQQYFLTHSSDHGTSGDFSYTNWSGVQGCVGGYPWSDPGSWGSYGCAYGLDEGVDPWQLYNRECVSYVAWALVNRFNKYVSGFHGSGMPDEWQYSSEQYSGAIRVYDPQPGDAVVLPPTSDGMAPVGHLMIVESVDNNSEYPIHISQYNWSGGTGIHGEYSTMDIKNSGIILLRFRDR